MSLVFEKVNPKLNTNANESLHTEVARVANKNTLGPKKGMKQEYHMLIFIIMNQSNVPF